MIPDGWESANHVPGRFAKARSSTPNLMLEVPKAEDRKDLGMRLVETQEKPEDWDKADFQVPSTHLSLFPLPILTIF